MESKNFFLTKSFWVNAITFILLLAAAFGVELEIDPETKLGIASTIQFLVALVMRAVTGTPVHFTNHE